MNPFYIKHKLSGAEFLVLHIITAAKITGANLQLCVRYFAIDPENNIHVLDPEEFTFGGLMPPPTMNAQPTPTEKKFSGLILPGHVGR